MSLSKGGGCLMVEEGEQEEILSSQEGSLPAPSLTGTPGM